MTQTAEVLVQEAAKGGLVLGDLVREGGVGGGEEGVRGVEEIAPAGGRAAAGTRGGNGG